MPGKRDRNQAEEGSEKVKGKGSGKQDNSESPKKKFKKDHKGKGGNGSGTQPKKDAGPQLFPILVRGMGEVSVADLQDLFGECGHIKHIKITGQGKALVYYEERNGATFAQKLNGTEMEGATIKITTLAPVDPAGVAPSAPKQVEEQDGLSSTVCVNTVPPGTTKEEIEDAASKYGAVQKVKIDKKREGVAFVEFLEKNSAKLAAKRSIKIGRTICKTVHLKQLPDENPAPAATPASTKKNSTTTALVSSLPEDVTVEELKSLFEPCGEIVDIRVGKNASGRIAFVEMATKTGFKKVLKQKGKDVRGKKITTSAAKNAFDNKAGASGGGEQARPKPQDCKTIIVKNLPYYHGDSEEKIRNRIKRIFKVCGSVSAVRPFMTLERGDNAPDPTFKGLAFVEFSEPDAADAALKMNGRDNEGRPMKIDWSDNRDVAVRKKKKGKKGSK